ncbi:MAG: hypothetical protein JWP97_2867 [Labilithrix sp.]|nr:hypothetical protein [Labilithrix sp.]
MTSPILDRRRLVRLALLCGAAFPLAFHVACSSDNGPPVGSVVFDASPLEIPDDHAEAGAHDASADGSVEDAASEAASDAAPEAAVDAGAPVVINEVYVDLVVRGDATEYVELRGEPNTPVDDLQLRILYADGTPKYVVAVGIAGERFNGNGLWVVGGTQTFKLNVTDHVDTTYGAAQFGLDTRGAVQLLRGTTLLDVVGYGPDADAGAIPPPPAPPTATSEGKPVKNAAQPAQTTSPARSIGRRTAAADTNANASDFCAMEASPGFPQKPCL